MLIERQPKQEFRALIERYWLMEKITEPDTRSYKILPDTNVDLLFEFSESASGVLLYGPATRAGFIRTDSGCDYFGIRCRPGKAPRLTDADAVVPPC